MEPGVRELNIHWKSKLVETSAVAVWAIPLFEEVCNDFASKFQITSPTQPEFLTRPVQIPKCVQSLIQSTGRKLTSIQRLTGASTDVKAQHS